MKGNSRNRYPLARVFTLAALLSATSYGAADQGDGSTRLTPPEIHWPAVGGNEAPGSSMQGAVQSLIIYGDASKADLYSIMFKVGPNATIPAHWHPDNRSCFVMEGVWYFGYGEKFNKAALKALPPGSHYTEPANVHHFADTESEGATVECTSFGPSGTTYVNPSDDPRHGS
jgi:quercetin dioxygenase-like cupin family protein